MAQRPFTIIFFKETSGNQPVVTWLKKLDKNERTQIGEDLQTLQLRWPLGMPLVRPLGRKLWELRSNLGTRIARIIFVVYESHIILLHGFIKKTQKTPLNEIEVALNRLKRLDVSTEDYHGIA